MSVLLPYAVVPADRLPPSAGATGGGLLTVVEGSVALVCEERDQGPSPSRGELVAFAKVLQALGADRPALPVRFGTVLEDLTEARELLRTREAQWRERLSYVAGHVELLVHLYDDRAPRPTPPSTGSGRDYLLSRAEARRHTDAMSEEVAALLAPHCRETRRLPGRDEVRVACLVRDEGTDKLRLALDGWVAARAGRHVTTTGPWSPFTFAEEDTP